MKYIKVDWIHDSPDTPVLLYSELDDTNWEVRKVEMYKNGRFGYASKKQAIGNTKLGIEPLPSFDKINTDPQFRLKEINQAEFESVWSKALSI